MIDDATTRRIRERLERALAPPARDYLPLRVGDATTGWLRPDRAARLRGFADAFVVGDDGVRFHAALADAASRTAALAGVAAALRDEGALTPWRDERYAAAPAFGAPPWFLLERAAARYFGLHTYAAHVNGVVRSPAGTAMWFARRSPDKAIDPGMLDNLVGGGIAAGASVAGTVVKESWEEAGIPETQARGALPAGALHIFREQPDGLQSETIFVHDLWLPETFAPANQDGEAGQHRRVGLPEAARLVALADGPDAVTADASLVVVDFLLRHGAISATRPSGAALERLRHAQAAARRA